MPKIVFLLKVFKVFNLIFKSRYNSKLFCLSFCLSIYLSVSFSLFLSNYISFSIWKFLSIFFTFSILCRLERERDLTFYDLRGLIRPFLILNWYSLLLRLKDVGMKTRSQMMEPSQMRSPVVWCLGREDARKPPGTRWLRGTQTTIFSLFPSLK